MAIQRTAPADPPRPRQRGSLHIQFQPCQDKAGPSDTVIDQQGRTGNDKVLDSHRTIRGNRGRNGSAHQAQTALPVIAQIETTGLEPRIEYLDLAFEHRGGRDFQCQPVCRKHRAVSQFAETHAFEIEHRGRQQAQINGTRYPDTLSKHRRQFALDQCPLGIPVNQHRADKGRQNQ